MTAPIRAVVPRSFRRKAKAASIDSRRDLYLYILCVSYPRASSVGRGVGVGAERRCNCFAARRCPRSVPAGTELTGEWSRPAGKKGRTILMKNTGPTVCQRCRGYCPAVGGCAKVHCMTMAHKLSAVAAELLLRAAADRNGWIERWPDDARLGDRLVVRGLLQPGRKPAHRNRVTVGPAPGFFITAAGREAVAAVSTSCVR
jgi:hypothetical protein